MHHPHLPPLAGPRDILLATLRASTTDRVALAAAGCAFWATTALFPAISALVAVYGLLFDPASVATQLDLIADLLPPPAFALIDDRVRELVRQPHGTLSTNLLIGILLALWSAATGTKAMLSALNVAYEAEERRGLLRFQATGLALTLLAVVGAVLAIAGVVLLPVVLALLGLSRFAAVLAHAASLALPVGFFAGAIALLYRVGPSRRRPPHAKVFPGAAAATLLWLAASAALSFYISHLARFGATYGPIGAVVGVMLWFYVSAYAALLGAELNARLDSTRVANRAGT